MSDEHMATAREVTRDWTPQTTLADSRRDIANALAAAEERGRRQGVEAAAKLTPELLDRVLHVLGKVAAGEEDSWTSTIARAVEIELRKARAPRDSGTCGADEDGLHREARKDRK